MEREQYIIEHIREKRLIPLFYHDDISICSSITKTMYEAGVRCIEFTNRGKNALDNFRQLVKERDSSMKDLLFGIGTIKNTEDATAFITAGADFLVSPVHVQVVAELAALKKILFIPGCMTPTEIHVANKSGASLIKLFPGNILGPSFIESVKPVFPGIEYLVTGGVEISEQNIRSWFNSGAMAVGIGSKLISKQVILDKDFKGLKEKTIQLIDIIRKIA